MNTLDTVQREAFAYFVHETNPENGLVIDKTRDGWPASIAATGLGLSCYPVGVERGFISRADALRVTLATLRFFARSAQGPEADTTGYRGFYYHFLDMTSGRRAFECELSTVDTALLLAGALTVAAYFTRDTGGEREVRELSDMLYRRVDWQWAQNNSETISQGWRPESGFVAYWYQGYDEALILYLLGLGAPDRPLPAASYTAWTASYEWKRLYDIEFLFAGPLFIHQLSHVWLDFRGIRDDWMQDHQCDYFENSRRATCVQQKYAIENPGGYAQYGEHCWGISASDGPGPATRRIKGVTREFHDYLARGVPFGPDDGTIAPWAVVASVPFAPEIVIPTVEYFDRLRLRGDHPYGFKATFNPTFRGRGLGRGGWVSAYHFGLNEGPIVLMIENWRSAMIWELMKTCPYVVAGLRRAGFRGGWLTGAST